MKKINVLILAAGKSTRIRKIFKDNPKPIQIISGKSSIERILINLLKIQNLINKIYINVYYKKKKIISHVNSVNKKYKYAIEYLKEEEILGTAGSLKNIKNDKNYPLMVIYGDNIFKLNLERFYSYFIKKKCGFLISIFNPKISQNSKIAGGKIIIKNSKILSFNENDFILSNFFVNAGIYLLDHVNINVIIKKKFFDFGKDVFPYYINKKLMIDYDIMKKDEFCLAFDNPESFLITKNILKKLGI